MSKLEDLDWDVILGYIDSGQAAIFLGPEVMQFDNKPMNQAWRDSLYEDFRQRVTHYYQQDGLFLFNGKIAKNDAAQYIRRYFEAQQIDEALYRKIGQIKFPLVISLNPDTYLSDVCYKYGIRHRFSYFKSRSKAPEEVEEPTKDLPLIYNLCGSKNEDESLILDYEDLFRLIASSLSTPGLPEKLKVALEKVRLFFFIGFQFEKWYTQLLLRLLCGQEESQKYATAGKEINKDTQDFLIHQFQIDFLERNQSLIDLLYERCALHNLLRDVADPVSEEDGNIIRHIQTRQDLFSALNLLGQKAQATGYENDVNVLQASYNNLIVEKQRGTVDSRDYFVQYNRIIDGILSILSRLSEHNSFHKSAL